MFYGSYTALITPFNQGNVDEEALRQLVNWQIDQGTQGLVPVGTTGESPTITEAEHKRIIEIVVEETAGRVPVIAGAGSNNPAEALVYAKTAERAGADGILCVAGYYNRPSQAGLYEHFKLIHDQTNIPIIIYNIPPRTIVDVQPQTMAQLAALPRITGVKDATMDLSRISRERSLIKRDFSYMSGEDITAVAYNALGGRGCISVTANVAPALCAAMQSACQNGDYQTALAIHERLMPLHLALFEEPSPSGIKYALSLTGICQDEVRLPILPASAATREKIEAALTQLSLI
ncbi:4-hydroxy-tetrahydrodipicolinate synthase [Amphritea pacifica]|uniref:4-hydroxy-tetrahydrodipicolinate synthase n=1 Tax=Amphritea pacifica TaxID=2811233 RepID=A0ABS2W986_9GAMM|nr:4-hydroxy-tetrahydrodipicolinate synthase [Amphritea pacifica]MBN0988077.1 4-hydroxy-tetrahydrodipicolinate synthase [Amphritea pacifica]MBN1006722.1 4-hydroxy-tetrahydrodipicolinate synthase [Amphritea pacifica]